MRQQHSNGRGRPSRDPGYRRSLSATPFWPLPTGHELTVCSRCSAVVPASERTQARHKNFHETILGLEDGRAR
jgi:hypothetical protein